MKRGIKKAKKRQGYSVEFKLQTVELLNTSRKANERDKELYLLRKENYFVSRKKSCKNQSLTSLTKD